MVAAVGMRPSLITGANAKITFNGKTLAYATEVNYAIETATIPVEVMGRYEVVTNEPIATTVSGSFSVVRYTKAGIKENGLPDTNADGNSVNKIGQDTKMGDAFNPKNMLTTETVDIVLYQVTGRGATVDTTQFLKIKDCRLTRMQGGVNKRGIVMEQYQFVGVLADQQSDEVTARSNIGSDLS